MSLSLSFSLSYIYIYIQGGGVGLRGLGKIGGGPGVSGVSKKGSKNGEKPENPLFGQTPKEPHPRKNTPAKTPYDVKVGY